MSAAAAEKCLDNTVNSSDTSIQGLSCENGYHSENELLGIAKNVSKDVPEDNNASTNLVVGKVVEINGDINNEMKDSKTELLTNGSNSDEGSEVQEKEQILSETDHADFSPALEKNEKSIISNDNGKESSTSKSVVDEDLISLPETDATVNSAICKVSLNSLNNVDNNNFVNNEGSVNMSSIDEVLRHTSTKEANQEKLSLHLKDSSAVLSSNDSVNVNEQTVKQSSESVKSTNDILVKPVEQLCNLKNSSLIASIEANSTSNSNGNIDNPDVITTIKADCNSSDNNSQTTLQNEGIPKEDNSSEINTSFADNDQTAHVAKQSTTCDETPDLTTGPSAEPQVLTDNPIQDISSSSETINSSVDKSVLLENGNKSCKKQTSEETSPNSEMLVNNAVSETECAVASSSDIEHPKDLETNHLSPSEPASINSHLLDKLIAETFSDYPVSNSEKLNEESKVNANESAEVISSKSDKYTKNVQKRPPTPCGDSERENTKKIRLSHNEISSHKRGTDDSLSEFISENKKVRLPDKSSTIDELENDVIIDGIVNDSKEELEVEVNKENNENSFTAKIEEKHKDKSDKNERKRDGKKLIDKTKKKDPTKKLKEKDTSDNKKLSDKLLNSSDNKKLIDKLSHSSDNKKLSDKLPNSSDNKKLSDKLPNSSDNKKLSDKLPDSSDNKKPSDKLPNSSDNKKFSDKLTNLEQTSENQNTKTKLSKLRIKKINGADQDKEYEIVNNCERSGICPLCSCDCKLKKTDRKILGEKKRTFLDVANDNTGNMGINLIQKLEELVAQSVTDWATNKCDVGVLRKKAHFLEEEHDRLLQLTINLKKQLDDARCIMKRMIDEKLAHKSWAEGIVPLKVTRSVGLQVCTTGSAHVLIKAPDNTNQRMCPPRITTVISATPTATPEIRKNIENGKLSNKTIAKSFPKDVHQKETPRPESNSIGRIAVSNLNNLQNGVANNAKQAPVKPNPVPSQKIVIAETTNSDEEDDPDVQVIEPASNEKNSSKPAVIPSTVCATTTSPSLTTSSSTTSRYVLKPSEIMRVSARNANQATSPTETSTSEVIDLTENDAAASPVIATAKTTGSHIEEPSPVRMSSGQAPSTNTFNNFKVPTSTVSGASKVITFPADSTTTYVLHRSSISSAEILPTVSQPSPPQEILLTSLSALPPLPCSPQYLPNIVKPPRPVLKICKNSTGILLSWTFEENIPATIRKYQVYAYQEIPSLEPNTSDLWRKVGDVDALPLPMACSLTQFKEGHKYFFIVRAMDVNMRLGEFSLPGSIMLTNTSSLSKSNISSLSNTNTGV